MTTKAKPKRSIKIFENLNEINSFAAQRFVSIGKKAIKQNNRFTVSLPGGSTPRSLYQLLSSDQYQKSRIAV